MTDAQPLHPRLAGRSILITGGAGGIGLGISRACLANEMRVVVLDRDAAACRALLEAHDERQAGRLACVTGDTGDAAALDEAVAALLALGDGRACHLVNNAVASCGGILSDASAPDVLASLSGGLVAAYELTRRLLPHLAEDASIVNIASTRARQSQPDTESYAMVKGGMLALTHALAVSLAGRCRVNAISPGWIDTTGWHVDDAGRTVEHGPADAGQHPAGRVGRPGDIARAALFLLDPAQGFITGENLVVDGGMSRLMVYHDDQGWRWTPAD